MVVEYSKQKRVSPLELVKHPAFKKHILKDVVKSTRRGMDKIPPDQLVRKMLGEPITGRPDQADRISLVGEFFLQCEIQSNWEYLADLLLEELRKGR
jgi:hypothetical protein